MANHDHLKILAQGVEAWNKWRREEGFVFPNLIRAKLSRAELCRVNLSEADLSGADFMGADLTSANLRRANLSVAKLRVANLMQTDLSGADISGADLNEANLSGTNLKEANLNGADLKGANLRGANLSYTTLIETDLVGADLTGANLMGATLSETRLGQSKISNAHFLSTVLAAVDLSQIKGLELTIHRGPSTIGIDTLMLSKGKIPESFLRGAGVPDTFIQYARSLVGTALEFYSCFISYSHADKSFARRLHDSLQGRGIRCWLDEKQLLPGDNIHKRVDEALRLWDKVLLCCSEHSLTSWWVDKEVQKALMREEQLWKERGKEVLAIIPLNLDGYMFNHQWEDWKNQHLTTRLAADFTGWEKDNSKFVEQLELVIKALRADSGIREQPPKLRL